MAFQSFTGVWAGQLGRRFEELQRRILPAHTERLTFLEIGCARSAWLSYFVREFGLDVHGLDYSERGCTQASQILENEGVEGEIVRHADFFGPPGQMLGQFDVVWSMGVLEHLPKALRGAEDPGCLSADGGRGIGVLPARRNIDQDHPEFWAGALGSIQRLVNRSNNDIHVPLDRDAAENAHRHAGLETVLSEYFMFASFPLILENLTVRAYRFGTRLNAMGTRPYGSPSGCSRC